MTERFYPVLSGFRNSIAFFRRVRKTATNDY